MTGPWDPRQPRWGQPGRPEPDPTRAFPQPQPWTGAVPPPGYRGPPPTGPPPYGPPPYGPPPYGPLSGQPYGGPPPYGPPPGQPSGWGGGFPPEIGGGGRGRGPLVGGLAAVLVLLIVLGIVLHVRSGNGSPVPAGAGTSSSTTPATPPRPGSVAPSRTTPAPSTTGGSGTASRPDVQAISSLAQQLVGAIGAGDQPTLQSIACDTFGTALAQFTTPTDPPLTYIRIKDVSVTGDDGRAVVFAASGSAPPTPLTMTVKRAGDRWKVCGLANP